jgi:hypothetical protein
MNSFIRFLLFTLLFTAVAGGLVYLLWGRQPTGDDKATSVRSEQQFLSDVQQADSLHTQLKKTDPAENASAYSSMRFKLDETVRRMNTGYGGDSLFTAICQATAKNYHKLLGAVTVQNTDRQSRSQSKQTLTLQIDGLKSEIQTLETQLILKQASLDNLRNSSPAN